MQQSSVISPNKYNTFVAKKNMILKKDPDKINEDCILYKNTQNLSEILITGITPKFLSYVHLKCSERLLTYYHTLSEHIHNAQACIVFY